MSAGAALVSDPFETVTLDEETELRTLSRALELSQGFSLIFARCNQPVQRQRIISDVRSQLPHLDIQEISLREPIPHLLDELRSRFPEPPTGPIFVSGLEYSLPVAAEAHATPFVANLNAARNSFPHVLHSPLVLWVPEYVLAAIMRGAPDFFSVRSGVYYFVSRPEETASITQTLASGEAWSVTSLPISERLERVSAIEGLLEDYQALPTLQRDQNTELRLQERLGNLYTTLGRWQEAEQIFQKLLLKFQTSNDMVNKGITLNNLGLVYRHQQKWEEAEDYFSQFLSISRKLGDRLSEGQACNNLGTVYDDQGQWTKALEYYQKGLAVCQEFGDRLGESQSLNNIGSVYHKQGDLFAAEQALIRSLSISREMRDQYTEGLTLSNLAIVYARQGRVNEAESALQQYIAIMQRIGNYSELGRALQHLSSLRAMQGDIAGAFLQQQEAVSVLEKAKDQEELIRVRSIVDFLEQQIQQTT